MAKTLYIGGLTAQTTETIVESLFSDYGVVEVRLAHSECTCRGYGWVTVRQPLKAKRSLDGKLIDGLRLRVELAG